MKEKTTKMRYLLIVIFVGFGKYIFNSEILPSHARYEGKIIIKVMAVTIVSV